MRRGRGRTASQPPSIVEGARAPLQKLTDRDAERHRQGEPHSGEAQNFPHVRPSARLKSAGRASCDPLKGEQSDSDGVPRSRTKSGSTPLGAAVPQGRGQAEGERSHRAHPSDLDILLTFARRGWNFSGYGPCPSGAVRAKSYATKRQALAR